MITTIWNFFFFPDKISWKGVRAARMTYFAIAVLTFGHVAGQTPSKSVVTMKCPASRPDLKTCLGYQEGTDRISTSARGVFGGVFWPLYWSWNLQAGDPA